MRDHPVVVYGIVSLGLLVVLLTGPTDAQRIYPLLFLFGVAYFGTEVLRRQTEREFPGPKSALPASSRRGRSPQPDDAARVRGM